MSGWHESPCRWYVTQLVVAGRLKRKGRVQPTKQGPRYHRTAPLAQRLGQPLLFPDERVDPGRLAIEVVGNGLLLVEGRDWKGKVVEVWLLNASISNRRRISPSALGRNRSGFTPKSKGSDTRRKGNTADQRETGGRG